jgi:hypothetical protein
MDFEAHYELISSLYTFKYWDKVSDVKGVVSLLPSVLQKHEKLIEEAEKVLTIYKKIKAKNTKKQKKVNEMIALATKEMENAIKFKETINASLLPAMSMKRPVIVSHSGIPQEVIDIARYDEVQNLSDEEALAWFRNHFLSDVMEKSRKSGFYGDDFGKMCLRMRADLDKLYEWVKEVREIVPSAPPVPVLTALEEDEEASTLYEKAVLCNVITLEELPAKKQKKVAQKIEIAAQKGYITKKVKENVAYFLKNINNKEK